MTGDYKENLLHRLKIIRGHLDKVIKMVEDDEYCLDILQQSTAVGSALKGVDQAILENHLRTCVKGALVSKKEAEEKVAEIIKVFRARR
jgi:DNA-binding FrmR family transcriptional regulator